MSIPPIIFATSLKDRRAGGAAAERIRRRKGMFINGVEVIAHAIDVSRHYLECLKIRTMEKYMINLDWLQLYCMKTKELDPVMQYISGRTYEFKEDGCETSMWRHMGHVYAESMEIATVQWEPRSSVIDQRSVSVKMHNRILYTDYWWRYSTDVMELLGLEYKGITRIDVCYDCNRLAGGRSVPAFLQDFVAHDPLCAGHIIRTGSRRMTIHASRSSVGGSSISAVRWGSYGNDVGAYCYNKTLEMVEKKRKPWIEQRWMEAGLVNLWRNDEWDNLSEKEQQRYIDMGYTETKLIECPVWRFELSIKAHGKDLLNKNTGECLQLSLSWLNDSEAVENLFYYYARKYFDFRINEGVERLRDYTPMKLFEQSNPVEFTPRRIVHGKDTGRTEKIVMNTIKRYRETFCDLSKDIADALDKCCSFFAVQASKKNYKAQLLKQLESVSYMTSHRFFAARAQAYVSFVDYAHRQLADPTADCDDCLTWFSSLYNSITQEIRREDAREHGTVYMPIL